MSARHPSCIALAVFDCFIYDNDPLRGDLIEEFEVRQSQLWLWRQVLSAVAHRPWPQGAKLRGELQLGILSAAMLGLLAFQAVFVTNAIDRFLFAPVERIAEAVEMWRAAAAVVSSLPIGWFIARIREQHRLTALAAFGVSITLCAALNLQAAMPVQLLTSICFIVGLLVAGTIEAIAMSNYPSTIE
jgi:hypothetical protein